uniref:Ubiquitin-like-conjugating enzyme ATG10 n=1 Tax=Seriola lalandi dorsalis TaxID=1841481 RepID=A0A3B4YDU2_SERLL
MFWCFRCFYQSLQVLKDAIITQQHVRESRQILTTFKPDFCSELSQSSTPVVPPPCCRTSCVIFLHLLLLLLLLPHVCGSEGRSLSLEEVWGSVHPNFRVRLQSSPLSTVTQQEHPLLGQPFFMLHPCRTEEFMRPVLQAKHSGRLMLFL